MQSGKMSFPCQRPATIREAIEQSERYLAYLKEKQKAKNVDNKMKRRNKNG